MRKLAEFLNFSSALLLGILTLLICADVTLRFLRHPIPGSYDITEFLTSLMLSFAILKSFQNKNHITIDLVDNILSGGKLKVINLSSRVITAVFLGILSVSTFSSGINSKLSGEVSMTLGIPLFLGYIAIGLCAGFTFLNEACFILSKIFLGEEIGREIKELGGERA